MPDETAQLELVSAPRNVIPSPTIEDALVLYCEPAIVTDIIVRLRTASIHEVRNDDPGLNPYWPRNGATTFVDPGARLRRSLVVRRSCVAGDIVEQAQAPGTIVARPIWSAVLGRLVGAAQRTLAFSRRCSWILGCS